MMNSIACARRGLFSKPGFHAGIPLLVILRISDDWRRSLAYNPRFTRKRRIMEAEQLNSLQSLLKDLTDRSIELRRYL
jgi:hypothetical protein